MPTLEMDNVVLNYEVRGSGKPIVFLHGLGASWKMWEPQIEAFSKKYQMIMVDLRGHGGSTKSFPNHQFSAKVMAEDIKQFLDKMNIEKTYMVGLSYGSVVAQLFACKYSIYLEKLILSNGYSEIPTKVSGWVLSLSNFIFKRLSYKTIINLLLKTYRKDEYTKKVLRNSFTFDKDMFIFAKSSDFPTHTDKLHGISVPTLVMGGDKKVMGVDERKASEILFNHIPFSTLALFKNAFDPLSTMKVHEFNEMIQYFLEDKNFRDYDDILIYTK
ncbi:alpha/beta hydrolase [Fictibacillus phosphorivorans]|uniref:Alpha/beta hydrolase n=1 Tax=Fictibacillus phosphorivorans TaxID=1221500 RepID=A0A160IP75_9BACL|nr:alpha/beta hydrolase [Fictibacillus phosphorivorans]ANC77750.1 alpha/beta hydrolase [Fictibacillus phosphorivorans]